MNKLETAKDTLRHYFTLIAKEAGLNLSTDQYQEIDSIVDNIAEHIKDEIHKNPPIPIGSRVLRNL